MKNILIINLRRFGDLYSTGHLINSIKAQNPDAQISMLVYKEFEKASRNIKDVDQYFMIDRKKIISLRKNPIFSPALAIEKLFDDLEGVKNNEWDQIINYSNDKVGTYLTSYIYDNSSQTEVSGLRYLTSQTPTHSSDWAILLNDVLPCYRHTPIHFVDCYHHMSNVPYTSMSEPMIKTHSKHNNSAKHALDQIRQDEEKTKPGIKLVGIQLKTSDLSKDIPAETVIELINHILESKELFPVLLIAPFANEQELANDINSYFDNTLVVIEADLYALGSVVSQLDAVVTPDTFIKHMCDLTTTPLVEVSRGKSPFLKQGTYNLNSYVITPSISTRDMDGHFHDNEARITSRDIYQTLQLSLGLIKLTEIELSNQATIYKPTRDMLGITYSPISGSYDLDLELSRYMSRHVIKIMQQVEGKIELSLFRHIKSYRLSAWLDREKNAVTELTKDILSTLKHLLLSQKNKMKNKEFVISLERLLAHAEENHIATLPLLFFRARVESLCSKNSNENIKHVEEYLYKLKTDMQLVLNCLKELEENIQENKTPVKTGNNVKPHTEVGQH